MQTKKKVLILDCFSCQIDLIESLLVSKFAEHLDISAFSTNEENLMFSVHEPKVFKQYVSLAEDGFNLNEYVDYILGWCSQDKTDVLFVGKNTSLFEEKRSKFEAFGITLITGTFGLETKDTINNKYKFSQYCENAGLPFIPSFVFNSEVELQAHLNTAELAAKYLPKDDSPKFCVKPTVGIYASGFFVLDDNATMMKQLSEQFVSSTKNFIQAYSEYEKKPEYILMPYIKGVECSVDVICSKGKYLDSVQRIKYGKVQVLERPRSLQLLDYIKRIVKDLCLDGLINIQFILHDKKKWLALEVNARPSGGYVYSHQMGFSLFNNLIAHKLGLTDMEDCTFPKINVRQRTNTIRVN